MTGSQWKVVLLAAILMAVDYFLGPRIQFGFFYVVPVMLAAWYHGAGLAVGLAVVMAATRFAFHWWWEFPMAFLPTLVNNAMRVAMLALIALAIARLSRHVRELRERIAALEKHLPVCAGCGVIRREDGAWVPLATVPAPATRPLCPRCEEKHYGTFA